MRSLGCTGELGVVDDMHFDGEFTGDLSPLARKKNIPQASEK
jgi:hypothetical protein